MPNKQLLKKYFIITVISSLVITALIAILVVLFGSFGAIETKILASTLAIGIFSITGLANLRNLESEHPSYRRFAWLSIVFSLVATLLTLSLIWISLTHTPWKTTLVFSVLSISTAHASLLLSSRSRSTLLNVAVTTTLACIAFVAGFLIYLITTGHGDLGQFFYRLLAVFVILDVLGTITVPILSRLAGKETAGLQDNLNPSIPTPINPPANNFNQPPPSPSNPIPPSSPVPPVPSLTPPNQPPNNSLSPTNNLNQPPDNLNQPTPTNTPTSPAQEP